MKRRDFVKDCATAGAAGAALAAGLVPVAFAEEFDPFQAQSVAEVLNALRISEAEPSDRIRIRAPAVAENGAAVPIGITSAIEGTTEILAIAAANPKPLAARYRFDGAATPAVETRLKIGKTTELIAVVRAGDRYYTAKTEIKVTRGGCGG